MQKKIPLDIFNNLNPALKTWIDLQEEILEQKMVEKEDEFKH